MVATNRFVSTVIMVERKEEAQEYGVQRPVYYVSEVLTESKQHYPHYQKLAYEVFLALHKLRHYFYDHKITVVSKAPLKDIINNSDVPGFGRIHGGLEESIGGYARSRTGALGDAL
jgi:predicted metallo-beta-lactamase superfamily hydrolase